MEKEDPIWTKAIETVEKHSALLAEGKPYEFSVKIKSLSNRKTQTKKYE